MTVQSLMERCTELGIKLALKGDDNDRLMVDAPKGTLTADLREGLAAHKLDVIAILKSGEQEYSLTQTRTPAQTSLGTESGAPTASTWNSPEATPLNPERPLASKPAQVDRTDVEVKKLLTGSPYDESIIDPKESVARRNIAAKLLEALGSRDSAQQDLARRAFMSHGYFDETSRQLRTGDSPAERVAAARKLGAVRSPMATAHLIASLHDSAPEVRKASTESLGQLGDPAAIPSLNELLLRETSRQLPEAVIRHAINSIAVTEAKTSPPLPQQSAISAAETIVEKPPAQPNVETPAATSDPKKQRHEIFAEYLSSFEQRETFEPPTSPAEQSPVTNALDYSFDETDERLRMEEEGLRKAAEAVEHKLLGAEAARRLAEEEARIKVEREAQIRTEVEARMSAEEEAHRRMAEEAARQRAEEDARVRAEQEARARAEEEARLRAKEEAEFRLEAETLRKAAEELARKRAAAEASRKLAEEEAIRKAAEEALRRAEEEARLRAEEEVRRKAEEEVRRRVEEELRRQAEEEAQARAAEEVRMRAAVEARIRAEAEAQRKAEEEAQRKAEEELRRRMEEEALRRAQEEAQARAAEEARMRAAVEARIRAEEEARRQVEEELRARAAEEARVREAEERHRAEEARLLVEQETLMQVAAELSRRRSELEEARHKAEEEARLLVEAQHRAEAEEESRRQMEAERQRDALERKRLADEALLAESLRRAAEEQQASAQARIQAEEQERYLADLGSVRNRLEEEAKHRSEQEQHIKAEILALSKAEEEQSLRIEAEIKRRTDAVARLDEQEARVEEESLRTAEEIRLKFEAQAHRRAEAESLFKEQQARLEAEQEVHARAEEDARRLGQETRARTEAEANRRVEAEVRLKEEEAKLRAEQVARVQAEEEALRLAEETRARTEAEANRRAEVEARLKEEAARLEAEQEANARAEEDARRLAAETRLRAEAEAYRRAEAEARLREEEARLQAEQEARARAEEESLRLAEETRLKAEDEARRRAEAEARLKEEEARLQAEHESRVRAEAEATRIAEEIRLRTQEEARRRVEVEEQLKAEEARLQAERQARLKAERAAQVVAEEIRAQAEEQARRLVEAEARLKEEKAQLLANAEAKRFEEEVSARAEEESHLTKQASWEPASETQPHGLFQVDFKSSEPSAAEIPWVANIDQDDHSFDTLALDEEPLVPIEEEVLESSEDTAPTKGLDRVFAEKGIASAEDEAGIPSDVLKRLNSTDPNEREAGLKEVVQIGGDDAFRSISRAFDDQVVEVRNAAARALFDLNPDRAATFTRALREGSTERRRRIGQALAASGLAADAVGHLTGESRERTYDAFSLLFLMAKAGEVHPLMQAIEEYPNVEVRIAVVKLLALSGQPEIVPAFRRLAVRGSLPSEVRSAVMEAIYQISSQARESAPSAA